MSQDLIVLTPILTSIPVVTMFSGCRDEQTSADANIGGMA